MITRNRLIIIGVIGCFMLWKLLNHLPLSYPGMSLNILPVELQDIQVGQGTHEANFLESLHVSIFYETLCPDSRSFFIRQLLPTFERAPKLMKLSLIPYGKASTQKEAGNKYLFNCQHGPTECQGNKVHSCAIRYVNPPSTLLHYTTCMISDNSDPQEAGRKCAIQVGVDWQPILQCSLSEEGSVLLAQMGEITQSLQPSASFIPTIEVNKDLQGQPALLKDLFKELCSRFEDPPAVCL